MTRICSRPGPAGGGGGGGGGGGDRQGSGASGECRTEAGGCGQGSRRPLPTRQIQVEFWSNTGQEWSNTGQISSADGVSVALEPAGRPEAFPPLPPAARSAAARRGGGADGYPSCRDSEAEDSEGSWPGHCPERAAPGWARPRPDDQAETPSRAQTGRRLGRAGPARAATRSRALRRRGGPGVVLRDPARVTVAWPDPTRRAGPKPP
jgi:hypothetical protein